MCKLWVRVGDGGDYDEFGSDLDAVVEYLNELDVGEFDGTAVSGITTTNYWGNDYISLYWGDDDANMDHLLSADELEQVKAGLLPSFI